MAGWPVPVTNRVAYGFAAGVHGGRSLKHVLEWSLSAADFPFCDQAFDDFVPPTDAKREKRPRPPQTVDQRARSADDHIKAF
eukprot:10582656-Lingulodinium_polyedra.AAC.1